VTRACTIGAALLTAFAARADTSVAKPAASAPGWCLQRYLKDVKLEAPKPVPPATTRPVTIELPPDLLRIDLPNGWIRVRIDATLSQMGPDATGNDQFSSWEPTLQVGRQTRAALEARIKAIQSDFTGTTRAEIEVRPASFAGKPANELCALVRRTAGHATLIDGTHRPMPDEVELVHGFLFEVAGKSFTVYYRLPPGSLDQQPLYERILASLRVM
jgi:hypothetical protein